MPTPGQSSGEHLDLLRMIVDPLREDLRQFRAEVNARLASIEEDLRDCATRDDLRNLAEAIPTTDTIKRKVCAPMHGSGLDLARGDYPALIPKPTTTITHDKTTWGRFLSSPSHVLAAIGIVVAGVLGLAIIAAVSGRPAADLVPEYRDAKPVDGAVRSDPSR
jgi:hypothetical protein